MLTKKCTKCGVYKIADRNNFYIRDNGNLRGECVDCILTIRKNHRANNPDKVLMSKKKYRLSHKSQIIDYNHKYNLEHKKERQEYFRTRIIKEYGLTLDQYDSMLIDQLGLCYICSKPMLKQNEPCVDHCHDSSLTRKLLCHACNTALGLIKENLETAKKLLYYIESVCIPLKLKQVS